MDVPEFLFSVLSHRPTQRHTDLKMSPASRENKNCKYEEEAFHQQQSANQVCLKPNFLIRANPFNPCPKDRIHARIQVMHVLHERPGLPAGIRPEERFA